MKIEPIIVEVKGNRSFWYGHVMRRDEEHVTKQTLYKEGIP